MDQLIFSIILTVLAAIVLSRLLKGLLRIVAIALVSFTLIVVSANISNSSSSWPSLSSWLNIRSATPSVEATAETSEDIVDPPSNLLPAENEVIAENEAITSEAVEATISPDNTQRPDPDFAGVTAMVGSPQDPNITQALSAFVSTPSSDLNSTQVDNLDTNQTDGPATSASPPNHSPRPINALW